MSSLFKNIDRIRLGWLSLLMAAITLLSFNLLSQTMLRGYSLDLTEDGLYTITEATRSVLASVDEPIQVDVYFSPRIGEAAPSFGQYFQRVRSMLTRYADLAHGDLQIAFHRPEAFSDEEDQAMAAGLTALPIGNSSEVGYFGLVARNSTDNQETIAFFTPRRERFLEYDLTRLVDRLANPKKPIVGLMSTLPVEGNPMAQRGGGKPWVIIEQLRETVELKSLQTDITAVPEDVQVLLLVHPRELSDQTLYAIDQFVLRGGRLLAFVDPNAETAVLGGARMATASEFDKLLTAWGVRLKPETVAADLDSAQRLPALHNRQQVIIDNIVWLELPAERIDRADAVAANIELLTMATAGVLEPIDKATTRFSPLVQTSPKSQAVPVHKVQYMPDAFGLLRAFRPRGEPFTLAARIHGPAQSAFPDGRPSGDTAQEDPAEDAAEPADKQSAHRGQGDIAVLLVADVDMLYDSLWADIQSLLGQRMIAPFANNADFILNAVENLLGGRALIGLRGRGIDHRPFTLIDTHKQEAEGRYRAQAQKLEAEIKSVEQQLQQARTGTDGNRLTLSDKERTAIEQFVPRYVSLRRELRDVQRDLRRNIESLSTWIMVINIAAVPLLVLFGSVVWTLFRRRRTVP